MNANPPPLLRPENEFLGVKTKAWMILLIGLLLLLALVLGLLLSSGGPGKGSDKSSGNGEGGNSKQEVGSNDSTAGQAVSEATMKGNESSEASRSEEASEIRESGSDVAREGNSESNSESGTIPDDSSKSSTTVSDTQTFSKDSINRMMTAEEKRKYSVPKGKSESLLSESGGGGFFGLKAMGSHVGYVVDISGSMSGSRLARAKKELRKSVGELDNAQNFSVFFFSDGVIFDQKFIDKKSTENNRRKLDGWLNQISTRGGTNPWPAVEKAFAEKCDEIFLLSDGVFDLETPDLIRTENKSETRINTISLNGSSPPLKKIARESGGRYIEP